MDELHRNCATLGLEGSITYNKTFYDDTSNSEAEAILFDRYS